MNFFKSCFVIIGFIISIDFISAQQDLKHDISEYSSPQNVSEKINHKNSSDLSIQDSTVINNLRAFAKLYGYVRFFHPSDEAANLDWDKFAVYGAEKVKNAPNDEQLKNILRELFYPIAPTVQIYSANEKPKNISEFIPKDTSGLKIVAWQHMGVKLSTEPNIYNSLRVYEIATSEEIKPSSKMIKSPKDLKHRILIEPNLFERIPKTNEIYKAKLDSALYCYIPLTLYCNSSGTLPQDKRGALLPYLDKLKLVNLDHLNGDSLSVRLADVIIAWNVMQHFFPYFDVVQVDWDSELTKTLQEALSDKSADEFYNTLRKMIASLQDGHGVVIYKRKYGIAGLPIRVEWIENKAVVTASLDSTLMDGDIIESIDGHSGEEELLNCEKYVSGSSQLKRFRALNLFGDGSLGSVAELEVLRNNILKKIKITRKPQKRSLFFNQISEFRYPPIKKIDEDIYYLNLQETEEKEFLSVLDSLKKAKGIIIDWRYLGEEHKADYKPINFYKLISYLISEQVYTPKWCVPQTIYPDRKQNTFNCSSTPILPSAPHIFAKTVFITDPSVVSYGETIMGIVDYYHLGEIVGEETAGTNGNVNFIILPGGYRIMWTGMKVLRQDGSQHHLLGIKPTYPVQRTIKAVKEGRDEYLEKALEVLKGKIK